MTKYDESMIEGVDFQEENWGTLLKKLKKEIRQSKDDDDRAAFLNFKIAQGYFERENKAAYAVRYCKQALQIDEEHGPSLDLIQDLYTELGKWEVLVDFYEEHIQKAQDDASTIHWLSRLAELHQNHTQERERHLAVLERILEIDPSSLAALKGLESIYSADENWEKLIGVYNDTIQLTEEADAVADLQHRLGSIYQEQLDDSSTAISYYEQALENNPSHIDTLNALSNIYEARGDWAKYIELMERTTQSDGSPEELAQAHYRIGALYEEKLDDLDAAEAAYDKAVEAFPDHLPSLRALNTLYTNKGDWANVIRLLTRQEEQAEHDIEKIAILREIATLYGVELEDAANATAIYERIYELDPSYKNLDMLSKLYDLEDPTQPKAIELHQTLLQRYPARVDSYRTLIRHYHQQDDPNHVFALISSLRLLDDLTPEEQNYYDTIKPRMPEHIIPQIEENFWQDYFLHPNAQTPLSEILAILYPFCGIEFAKGRDVYNVTKSNAVDTEHMLSKLYTYASKILNITPVDLHQSDTEQNLLPANTFPPVTLVPQHFISPMHPRELLFFCARALVFLRPEFLFPTVLDYGEYRSLISSCLHHFVPEHPLECPEEYAARISSIINTVPLDRKNELQRLAQEYVQDEHAVQPDQYLRGIEHTANRVGFCMADDLLHAANACKRLAEDTFNVPYDQKIKELLTFSISPQYLDFRKKQNLEIRM